MIDVDIYQIACKVKKAHVDTSSMRNLEYKTE